MERFKVTAWNNGKHDTRGNGYGIRIGKNDRHLFERNWEGIELSIEGNDYIEVSITHGFWNDCPELGDKWTGQWLIQNILAPLEKHNPPKFILTKLNYREFRLDVE